MGQNSNIIIMNKAGNLETQNDTAAAGFLKQNENIHKLTNWGKRQ